MWSNNGHVKLEVILPESQFTKSLQSVLDNNNEHFVHRTVCYLHVLMGKDGSNYLDLNLLWLDILMCVIYSRPVYQTPQGTCVSQGSKFKFLADRVDPKQLS